jgi:glycosyltransferase involved in cell wall biosynthesis
MKPISTPSVTVVLPTYDASNLLIESLRSLAAQTVLPSEVLLLDDGSNAAPVLPQEDLGLNIRLHRLPHQGLSATWNAGVRLATGDWIAFLDDDDLWHPTKLERQLGLTGNSYDFIFCQRRKFYTDPNRAFDPPPYLLEYIENPLLSLVKSFFATPSTALVRRALLLEAGEFDPALRSAGDYDMWIRLALCGCRFGLVNEALVSKRLRKGSIQGQQAETEKLRFLLKALDKNAAGLCTALGFSGQEWKIRMGRNCGYFLADALEQRDFDTAAAVVEEARQYGAEAVSAALERVHTPVMGRRAWYPEREAGGKEAHGELCAHRILPPAP